MKNNKKIVVPYLRQRAEGWDSYNWVVESGTDCTLHDSLNRSWNYF